MTVLPVPAPTPVRDPHSVWTLMREQRLQMHWQPLVDLTTRNVIGHEALVRTPEGCAWRNPDHLFAAARREGCAMALERACVQRATAEAGRAGLGLLFVNLSANAVAAWTEDPPCPPHGQHELPLAGVVVELTEHERVRDLDALREVLTRWRAAGAAVALDDFGDGHSSLRLWAELRPEYVKIDKYFVRDVHRSGDKTKTIRALQQLADTFGTQLIAEGIETVDELMVLRDLGLTLGQGYLLGRPQATPCTALPDPVQQALQSRQIWVLPQEQHVIHRGLTAATLLRTAPALPDHASHQDVLELFQRHHDLESVALLDAQQRPVGLIARHTFQEETLHNPYFRELYGRRPAIMHANTQPLCVEVHTPLERLTEVLTSPDQRYLREGFILTENGRYRGLGTSEQLVRRVTEARIEAARHANPLTALPGNVPITQHIERLLHNGQPFVACYADLNHFKVYNDQYGYWRGDGMIRLLARCLTSVCDPRLDFVGHVGGDDFVLLMQSHDWLARVERAVHTFNTEAALLYEASARQAGGLWAEDRHGVRRFHPLTTLSVGVVQVDPAHYVSAESVANAAALAKHHAKQGHVGIQVLSPTAEAPPHCGVGAGAAAAVAAAPVCQ